MSDIHPHALYRNTDNDNYYHFTKGMDRLVKMRRGQQHNNIQGHRDTQASTSMHIHTHTQYTVKV